MNIIWNFLNIMKRNPIKKSIKELRKLAEKYEIKNCFTLHALIIKIFCHQKLKDDVYCLLIYLGDQLLWDTGNINA